MTSMAAPFRRGVLDVQEYAANRRGAPARRLHDADHQLSEESSPKRFTPPEEVVHAQFTMPDRSSGNRGTLLTICTAADVNNGERLMHRRTFMGYVLGAAGVAVMAATSKLAAAAPASVEDASSMPSKTTPDAETARLPSDEVGAQWRRWGWRRRRFGWRRRWWGPRFYRRRWRRRYWRRRWAW